MTFDLNHELRQEILHAHHNALTCHSPIAAEVADLLCAASIRGELDFGENESDANAFTKNAYRKAIAYAGLSHRDRDAARATAIRLIQAHARHAFEPKLIGSEASVAEAVTPAPAAPKAPVDMATLATRYHREFRYPDLACGAFDVYELLHEYGQGLAALIQKQLGLAPSAPASEVRSGTASRQPQPMEATRGDSAERRHLIDILETARALIEDPGPEPTEAFDIARGVLDRAQITITLPDPDAVAVALQRHIVDALAILANPSLSAATAAKAAREVMRHPISIVLV